MKKQIGILFFLALCGGAISAQKNYQIPFHPVAPTIDGRLDDSIWQHIPTISDFTVSLPNFGATPPFTASVRLYYHPEGLCIGFQQTHPQVRAEGSNRDQIGTADYFTIGLDTWNDDQNAFEFTVTAAGQMIESRISAARSETRFDTPWKARAQQEAESWSAEIWIPFNALRYPAKGPQDWGLQLSAYHRSSGVLATWSPQDPLIGDRVLQYGALSGLTQIHSRMRLGISLYNYGDIERERLISPTFPGEVEIVNDDWDAGTALDGRIGWNPATTLDVTLLPERQFITDNLRIGSMSGGIFDGANTDYFDAFRQWRSEEAGLFAKSQAYEEDQFLGLFSLTGLIPRPPGAFVFPERPSKLLQESKLSTRTRNNIGIGVVNQVYSRPTFIVFDPSSSFFPPPEKYPVNPVFTSLSVEKALPNNGFVQMTHSHLHVGNNGSTHLAGGAMRWRDRSNRIEVSGNLRVFSQKNEKNKLFSVADGDFFVGKVNGKTTWGVDHQSAALPWAPELIPASAFIGHGPSPLSNAFVRRNNFAPNNKRWLFTGLSAFARHQWIEGSFRWVNTAVGGGWSATDRRFRNMSWSMGATPFQIAERLEIKGVAFLRQRSIPANMQAAFQTDQRKKLTLDLRGHLNWNFDFENYSAGAALSPRWVVSRHWVLAATHQWSYFTGIRAAVDTEPGYVFRDFNSLLTYNSLQVGFFPQYKWSFLLNVDWRSQEIRRQRAFEIIGPEQTRPVELTSPSQRNERDNWYMSAEVQWMFRTMSRLRFRYQFSHNYFPLGVPTFLDRAVANRAEITLIWHFFN